MRYEKQTLIFKDGRVSYKKGRRWLQIFPEGVKVLFTPDYVIIRDSEGLRKYIYTQQGEGMVFNQVLPI